MLDSAGIRIIEHQLGAPATEAGSAARGSWRLADAPELRIGADDGDEGHDLYRVTGAVLLDDGRVVVGVGGGPELRLYDASGSFVRTIGRRGAGPGEFRSLLHGPWLAPGGRLTAYDLRQRRLSVFDTSGALVSSASFLPQMQTDTNAILTHGIDGAADGRVLAFSERTDRSVTPGLTRGELSFVYLDTAGGIEPIAGTYGGQETFIGTPDSRGRAPLGRPPFTPNTLGASCGELLAIADNGAYDIRLVRSDGSVQAIIRSDVVGWPLTDDDLRGAAEATMPPGMTLPREVLDHLREISVHERLPVLHRLRCDTDGQLWVEEFARPSDTVRRVAAYTLDGRMRGTLYLPTSADLLGVRGDRVIVMSGAEDDAEIVEVVRLLPVAPG